MASIMTNDFLQGAVYSFGTVSFTFLGICLLWARWGRRRLRPVIPFADLLETWNLSKNARYIIEFKIFAILGTVLAIALVEPATAKQCIAAGLGWTGLVSKLET
ncbi:MAG: hypothetical protein RX316_08305 [bacterium]|nr:hypothetical protein [bacterium]